MLYETGIISGFSIFLWQTRLLRSRLKGTSSRDFSFRLNSLFKISYIYRDSLIEHSDRYDAQNHQDCERK